MKASYVGLFTGLILGIVAILEGFLAFLGVAFLGGLGLFVGLVIEGQVDLNRLTGAERSRR
ncbi:hypothetical protein [Nesterenkonia sandarakina]|uniref:Mg/Co/Ni transporter MgtE n=1 Tax=Nesterenkonia sandarakina TaxID=272918 RepID=A0A7Z0E6U8_9MICC|nr:hypothetical protein [Nesterenkonia sandarakina]NYJ16155.1 Mg/Co/Ni transporter MgtE [Nesterenkonia sandarakina]